LLQRLADRVELLLVNQGELRRATSPQAAITRGGQCLSCAGPVGDRDPYAAAGGGSGAPATTNAMYNRFGGMVTGAAPSRGVQHSAAGVLGLSWRSRHGGSEASGLDACGKSQPGHGADAVGSPQSLASQASVGQQGEVDKPLVGVDGA
jgi:hypothetical protein